jgi:GT2 family glycosyltransferase
MKLLVVLTGGIRFMADQGQFSEWRISIIVTTFNSLDSLIKVMTSINQQTVPPLEVIVADDGSAGGVSSFLDSFRGLACFPVIHSWQPDSGFRLSRSRNLAAAKASGDWLLFLDGDCLMPRNFIRRHLRLAESMHLVFGARKLLPKLDSEDLVLDSRGGLDLGKHLSGRKFLWMPLGIFRKFPRRSWRNFRGFLMGIDSTLFKRVAGFDETFTSWGLEDSDFAVRAKRAGGHLKDGRYANAVVHLYHPEPSVREKSLNAEAFMDLLSQGSGGRVTPKASIFLECW